jgi:hypothetical protein
MSKDARMPPVEAGFCTPRSAQPITSATKMTARPLRMGWGQVTLEERVAKPNRDREVGWNHTLRA